MTITDMQPLSQGRVKITLEEGGHFALYKKEAEEFDLKVGGDLPPAIYEEICREILIPRVKKRAMHLLSAMDRTEHQLREKLHQGYYGEDMIQIAVDYVNQFHYIDDLRYATSYIRYKVERSSKRQLKQELYQKGIRGEIIEQALEEAYTVEEEEVIKGWLEKRRYDPETVTEKERQKIYRFLMGKGFSGSEILRQI